MRILRSFGRAFLPAETPLPKRYWRWLWAAMVLRLLVGWSLFGILVVPYFIATVFVSAVNGLGASLSGTYARCHNRDLKNAGPVVARKTIPAPALSSEWQTRV